MVFPESILASPVPRHFTATILLDLWLDYHPNLNGK